MKEKELPFGTQFSPNVVDLKTLIVQIYASEGKSVKELENEIYESFYAGKDKSLAYNCKVAITAYGIIETGDIVKITDFGKELYAHKDNEEVLFTVMAKHILMNLNGLALIDMLRRLELNGEKVTNESVNEALIGIGYNVQKTSNYAQVMKLWLEKAGVLDKWKVQEEKMDELIAIRPSDISLFRELTPEQYYFLMALCNVGSSDKQVATEIRDLAIGSYNITFGEKAFANQVLKPLEGKGLIKTTKTTVGRGSKSALVELTDKSNKDIIEPLLNQFRDQVGNALAEAYCNTFEQLRIDIDDKNPYKKGLALEAFAIKIMKIIGLNFQRTRYRDKVAGGEVDVIFDSTRLMYTRWQVQCKNTSVVSIDQVAKEVGLSHVLKSNCIVMVTTGQLSSEAIKYANKIMNDTNLCILILQKADIERIIKNPTSIVEIFNKQAEKAKKVKILNDGEN